MQTLLPLKSPCPAILLSVAARKLGLMVFGMKGKKKIPEPEDTMGHHPILYAAVPLPHPRSRRATRDPHRLARGARLSQKKKPTQQLQNLNGRSCPPTLNVQRVPRLMGKTHMARGGKPLRRRPDMLAYLMGGDPARHGTALTG